MPLLRRRQGRPEETRPTEDTPRRLPEGLRLYAVGDIHGRLDLLSELHERIREDARVHDCEWRRIVYLGDYVDRGPSSRQVIDTLAGPPLEGFEAIHLLGNHEYFMHSFLRDPEIGEPWLRNGGDATLQSYGIEPWEGLPNDERRLECLSERLEEVLPPAHRAFLDRLELRHEAGDYLFVHAGVRPGVPLDRQNPDDLIWIREPFLNSACEFGKLVVHGHTPETTPVRRPNRICVDTGACYGGRLTALVLQGDRQEFLQA